MANLRKLVWNWLFGCSPDRRNNPARYFSPALEFLEDRTAPAGLDNSPPIACSNWYHTPQDTPLVVSGHGVLGNDYDADGDALTAVLMRGPGTGTLELNPDGSFVYTPAPGATYEGVRFAYADFDGQSYSNLGWVSIGVAAYVGDLPLAAYDSYAVNEDRALSIDAADGVLANDLSSNGNPLTAQLVDGAAHGKVNLQGDGSFTYQPDPDFFGSDFFSYKVNDGVAESSLGSVRIFVCGTDDIPVAHADAFTLNEDTTIILDVLANDVIVDGGGTAVIVQGPSHGSVTLNADGTLTYRPDANYNGEDTFFYRARDIDGSTSAAVAVNLTINPVNDPPRADAGARGMTINEGDIVAFDGSASTDVDGDPLEFTWYFGDGAVASGERVAHAFADNGAYKATLVVSDGACVSYDTIDILVNNAPPTAGLSGPASGVRGQVQTFSLSAKDPSPLDQQAGFRYSINWGDGTTETITGPGAASSGHVYAATGTYVVSMNAFDKDGAVSATAAQLISINAVEFQAGALVVGGTTGNDTIVVAPYDANGSLSVKINGSVLGVYAPGVTQILVYGQAGNDTIQIASNRIRGQTYFVKVDAMLFGDAGDDTLDARGSVANNVLIGGDGNDTLHGGANRDILLGGRGADILHGNGGDDLLVGNFTDWDANATALNALMAEWRRTDVDYATRANRLLGTSAGGKNGAYVLNGKTVHDDSAIDQLYGDAGQDMFLVAAGLVKDKTIDALGSELTATL